MNFIYLYTSKFTKKTITYYESMKEGLIHKGHGVRSILVDDTTSDKCISGTMNTIGNYDCILLYGWPKAIVNYIRSHKIPVLTLYDPPIRQSTSSRNYKGYCGLCWGQPHENYYYEDTFDSTRWKSVSKRMGIKVKDWQTNNDGVVLVGIRRELNFDGFNPRDNMDKLINTCSTASSNVVLCSRTRASHRDALKMWPKHKIALKTIKRLKTAKCLVTTGGTMVPKSIIAGVPCYYIDHTVADPLSITKNLEKFLSNPDMPDRTRWLNWAAYQQWSVDEIKTGLPFDYMFHTKNKVYDF